MGKYEESRQYGGNGTIKCGICEEPLAEHGPPPCPHAGFKITVAASGHRAQHKKRVKKA